MARRTGVAVGNRKHMDVALTTAVITRRGWLGTSVELTEIRATGSRWR